MGDMRIVIHVEENFDDMRIVIQFMDEFRQILESLQVGVAILKKVVGCPSLNANVCPKVRVPEPCRHARISCRHGVVFQGCLCISDGESLRYQHVSHG